MANFRQRRKFKSRVPQLKVDAGLPVGTYVFQLEVEDQNNNRSKAARVKVRIVGVRDPLRPGGGNRVIVPPGVTRGPTSRRGRPRDPS